MRVDHTTDRGGMPDHGVGFRTGDGVGPYIGMVEGRTSDRSTSTGLSSPRNTSGGTERLEASISYAEGDRYATYHPSVTQDVFRVTTGRCMSIRPRPSNAVPVQLERDAAVARSVDRRHHQRHHRRLAARDLEQVATGFEVEVDHLADRRAGWAMAMRRGSNGRRAAQHVDPCR